MTLTIEKTVQEEIELEGDFPLFRYSAPFYYKIFSLSKYLMVHLSKHTGPEATRTGNHEALVSDALLKGEVITEDEFKAAYRTTQKGMDKLAGDEERQRQELNEQIKDELQFPFPSKCTA